MPRSARRARRRALFADQDEGRQAGAIGQAGGLQRVLLFGGGDDDPPAGTARRASAISCSKVRMIT